MHYYPVGESRVETTPSRFRIDICCVRLGFWITLVLYVLSGAGGWDHGWKQTFRNYKGLLWAQWCGSWFSLDVEWVLSFHIMLVGGMEEWQGLKYLIMSFSKGWSQVGRVGPHFCTSRAAVTLQRAFSSTEVDILGTLSLVQTRLAVDERWCGGAGQLVVRREKEWVTWMMSPQLRSPLQHCRVSHPNINVLYFTTTTITHSMTTNCGLLQLRMCTVW
jgi:hypothetical protein